MIIFSELGLHSKDYIKNVKENLILSEEENLLFDLAVSGKSVQEMAFKLYVSPRTIFRMLAKVRTKIMNYELEKDCH